jgi:hypothetical protein
MARKRMLDPTLWDNEKFLSYPLITRLLWISLISLADDEGRGRASAKWWVGRVFPYDDEIKPIEIDAALEALSEDERILLYPGRNGTIYYQIMNWKKYQKVRFPSPSLFPPPDGNDYGNDYGNGFRNDYRTRLIRSDQVKLDQEREEGGTPGGSGGGSKTPEAPPELQGLELYQGYKPLIKRWDKLFPAWQIAYPELDVAAQIKSAHAKELEWIPQKRKKDKIKYIGNWLRNAQKGPPWDRKAPPPPAKVRATGFVDDGKGDLVEVYLDTGERVKE